MYAGKMPALPGSPGPMLARLVLEHFQRPRNAGELPGADAVVEVSNPVCGDVLRLAVIVENGVVRELDFYAGGARLRLPVRRF